MTTLFITLLIIAITIDVLTLAVIGSSLHQSVSNMTALRFLGKEDSGRSIVAKALIRRTVIQGAIVVCLATVSSTRLYMIYTGQDANILSITVLFTVQLLVAASAVYDVIERMHVIKWYDDHPGAREREAKDIDEDGINPNNISPNKT